jgi:hypothetical protein
MYRGKLRHRLYLNDHDFFNDQINSKADLCRLT